MGQIQLWTIGRTSGGIRGRERRDGMAGMAMPGLRLMHCYGRQGTLLELI